MIFRILSVILFCLISCASLPSHHYTNQQKIKKIKKVAVLPFSNLSTNPRASEIVTQIFIAELAKTNFFIIEELGNIIEFMIEQRLKIGTPLDKARLLLLKRRYKVDAVIYGKILTFEKRGDVPYVNFSVRMVLAENSEVIWKSSIEKNGEDYVKFFDINRIRSLSQLTQHAIQELIKTLKT